MATKQRLIEVLTTAMEKPEIANALIQRVINELNKTQPEPEPVAHLWECLGRWSAMLANDGEHADLSPPLWLCDAIEAATTPPQREWVGLTDEEMADFVLFHAVVDEECIRAIEAKLKEKNA